MVILDIYLMLERQHESAPLTTPDIMISHLLTGMGITVDSTKIGNMHTVLYHLKEGND
jgi:hypothetical protein